ncbi:MAG: cupin domain-containing protein [Pseudomonadota bacterium]
MDWEALRRIVTEDGVDGRSRVLIDTAAAKQIAVEEAGLAEIWTAGLSSEELYDATDRLAGEDLRLEPQDGAMKVRWFTVAPEDAAQSEEEKEAAAAFAFGAVGASHTRVDASLHPMMHKTETLDVIILVRGRVDLILDEGEPTSLKPGDVVIQRATNHAWANHGSETALLVAVLIKARDGSPAS